METEDKALTVVKPEDPGSRMLSAMQVERVRREIDAVKAFQSLVMSQLVEKVDYGTIPGTDKPTLLKSGAEKIAKLLALADLYEIVQQVEDWDKPLFSYTVRCSLAMIESGKVVSQGIGECNSMESKYRWRWVWPNDVPPEIDKTSLAVRSFSGKRGQKLTKYRLPNDDTYSLRNTILKMAKKRALVDAALSVGRLSGIVTQDLEELRANGQLGAVPEPEDDDLQDFPPDAAPIETLTEEQIAKLKELWEVAKEHGCTKQKAAAMMESLGAKTWAEIRKNQYEAVASYFKEWRS